MFVSPQKNYHFHSFNSFLHETRHLVFLFRNLVAIWNKFETPECSSIIQFWNTEILRQPRYESFSDLVTVRKMRRGHKAQRNPLPETMFPQRKLIATVSHSRNKHPLPLKTWSFSNIFETRKKGKPLTVSSLKMSPLWRCEGMYVWSKNLGAFSV